MTVSITIPADLQPFVQTEMSTGRFENEGQLVTKSLELYREMKQRHDELRAQVQQSLEEAARGEVEEFDVEAIITRGRERLAREGVTD
jgi:Arc/MetJ-type ribon-helix-helix transcriptional regulator